MKIYVQVLLTLTYLPKYSFSNVQLTKLTSDFLTSEQNMSKKAGKGKKKKEKQRSLLAHKQLKKRMGKERGGRKKVTSSEMEEMEEYKSKFVQICKKVNCLVSTEPECKQYIKILRRHGCPTKNCGVNAINNVFKRSRPRNPSRALHSFIKQAVDGYPENQSRFIIHKQDDDRTRRLRAAQVDAAVISEKTQSKKKRQSTLQGFVRVATDQDNRRSVYSTNLLHLLSAECLVAAASLPSEIYPIVLHKVNQFKKVGKVRRLVKLPIDIDFSDLVKKVKQQ